MVEVQIQELYRSDRNRPKGCRRAVIIDARGREKRNEDALRGKRRGALEKPLTEAPLEVTRFSEKCSASPAHIGPVRPFLRLAPYVDSLYLVQ